MNIKLQQESCQKNDLNQVFNLINFFILFTLSGYFIAN